MPSDFDRGVKNGNITCGSFLFYGEEGYLMYNSLKTVRNACFPEGDDLFGHTVISTPVEPITPLTVAVDEESVFSDRKLIELSEFSWPSRAGEIDRLCDELLPLCNAVNNSENTFLILYTTPFEFDAGLPPKRPSKLYELLCEECTPVHFALESEARLVKWMGRRAAALGATLPPAVAQEMISRAGKNMFCLIGEVEKASFLTLSRGRDVIEPQDLDLTVNNEEIAAFDFENALRSGNFSRALSIVREHEKDKDPPELISAVINNYAINLFLAGAFLSEGKRENEFATLTGINPYVASHYFRAAKGRELESLEKNVMLCSEADIKIKSGGGDVNYLIIENLLYRLIGKK